MSVAALVLVPVVVVYQLWAYKVFSRRLSTANIPDDAPEPAEAGSRG